MSKSKVTIINYKNKPKEESVFKLGNILINNSNELIVIVTEVEEAFFDCVVISSNSTSRAKGNIEEYNKIEYNWRIFEGTLEFEKE